jgi:hypothetical protein
MDNTTILGQLRSRVWFRYDVPTELARRSQAGAGNGIFVVGDRRPKTCLRDETYAQRRKSRPHDREKPAENRPFRRQVFHGEFRWTGWWAHQGSNLGPAD